MVWGPILRYEFRRAARRRGAFAFRTVLALVLATVTLVTGAINLPGTAIGQGLVSLAELRQFGQATLIALVVVQVVMLAFYVPGMVSGAIAEERDRGALSTLLMSRLTPPEIVLIKLAGRLLPALLTVAVGLPLVILAGWFAGLAPGLTALVAAGLALTAGVMGAFAILCSARARSVGSARSLAFVVVWGWLLGPPILAIAPIRSLLGWPELAEAVRWAFGRIAPSSPLAFLTQSSWWRSGSPEALADRLVEMVAVQAALIAIALVVASRSLVLREPRDAWLDLRDPFRGHRPRCGDDPIVWREFDLPNRRGSVPRLLAWTRQLVAYLRLLVVVVFMIAVLCLMLAIPLGLLGAAGYTGFLALREAWRFGWDAPPFQARDMFFYLVRGVTGFAALLGLGNSTAVTAGRITQERDKGTWLLLLTTPLTGREILGSKMRVAFRGWASPAWLLGALWVVAAASGSIHPLGCLLAGLDLAAAAWLVVALGLRVGARAGPSSDGTSTASSLALVLTLVHVPLIAVVLASPRDVTRWSDQLGWLAFGGAVLALAHVPLITAAIARSIMERSFERFDEWADRPHRDGRAGPRPREPEGILHAVGREPAGSGLHPVA